MTAQSLIGQPPLLVGRHPGQLQDVTAQLQLDAAPLRPGKPGLNRRHHGSQQLRLAKSDNQRAKRPRVHCPRPRRRLTRPWHLNRVDFKIKELPAKLQGGLSNVLGSSIGPGRDANAKYRWLTFHGPPGNSAAHNP